MGTMLREMPQRETAAAAAPTLGLRSADRTQHVVAIGAGFAGLAAVRALRRARVRITVIDRHNSPLSQPLLYQVATAGLSPADIASPIRGILAKQRNATVRLGRVTAIDLE